MCLGVRSLLCVTFAMEQHDVVHNQQWMEVEKVSGWWCRARAGESLGSRWNISLSNRRAKNS